MLSIDGKEYRVNVIRPSLVNSFEILEGKNSGTALDFRKIRDIGGTNYIYEMRIEPNHQYPEDFDDLFHILSAPTESHRVSLPYGQDTIEFDAAISSGRRILYGKQGGKQRWRNMEIEFIPLEPQRKPEGAYVD